LSSCCSIQTAVADWTRTANAQNLEADMLRWLRALIFDIFSGSMIDPDG
jgi:hypothetical protein